MDNQSLIDTIKIISYLTNIPEHRKDDAEFLRDCLAIIRKHVKAALEHDEKTRSSNRDTTRDDNTT